MKSAVAPSAQAYAQSAEAMRLVKDGADLRPPTAPRIWISGIGVWSTDRCPSSPAATTTTCRSHRPPGYVAILQEQIHEIRLIPLDGRAHVQPQIRQWLGDSRGHWEGHTLVVKTTNFSTQAAYLNSDAHRHVVERFTRIGKDRVEYTFTVTDPTTWTRGWTAMVPWRRTDGPIYEYACHEGNYGMFNLLAGARIQETDAAEEEREN